ncbi:tyrosine-protein phosphatase [Pandoraea sp. PE-S2R-1]|uniref:tyrosine-protein phosphatase n=1 Tax=Pandoraea sp. PE-S2R-1 TaxID=1986994 RepID=UPI001481E5F0|nr:tyrosine-protein phosphatase [Pandoraea sp. PE-S2R-1]
MHDYLRISGLIALGMIASAVSYAGVTFPIQTPLLTSTRNFRDIAGVAAKYGGTGLSNGVANNGVMRTGIFFRSGALPAPSLAEEAAIGSIGLTEVIDLRMPAEIAERTDKPIAGTVFRNIDMFSRMDLEILTRPATSVVATNAAFVTTYGKFVTDPAARDTLRTVLLDLASSNGPVLIHCTVGKDRTGWVMAILEDIAGVAPAQLMDDFLASNQYSALSIESLKQLRLAEYTPLLGASVAQEISDAEGTLASVSPVWLQTSLDTVTREYGNMQNYLIQGLRLTQADIYVLRAKMVHYHSLPGQAALKGNAARGAELLVKLQESPLSGRYTAFNNYFQSAVDGGTLGGVANQIGGQIHADSTANLLRQPLAVESAMRAYVTAPAAVRQTPVWVTVWANTSRARGAAGVAGSKQREYGVLAGITQPVTPQLALYAAAGNENQRTETADAMSTLDSLQLVAGTRYAFFPGKNSLFVDGSVMGSRGNYQSTRGLGNGLGTATGSSRSWLYSTTAMLGKSFDMPGMTLTPQIGVRYTQGRLGSFTESGSELALNMQGQKQHVLTTRARLDVHFHDRALGAWTFRPTLTLGLERTLGPATVSSFGTLQGYGISQTAAYRARLFGLAELSVQAGRGPLTAEWRETVGGGEHGAISLASLASLTYLF